MGMFTKLFALLVGLTFFATDLKPAEAAATLKPVEIDSEYNNVVKVQRRANRRIRRGGRGGRSRRRIRGRDVGIGLGIGIGSAIIGGAINEAYSRRYYRDPPRVYYQEAPRRARRYNSDSHVGWCSRRYRSYNARSDTYQPYNGRRRRCNSPYN